MLIGRNRGHFFLIFLSPRAKLLTPDWSSGENACSWLDEYAISTFCWFLHFPPRQQRLLSGSLEFDCLSRIVCAKNTWKSSATATREIPKGELSFLTRNCKRLLVSKAKNLIGLVWFNHSWPRPSAFTSLRLLATNDNRTIITVPFWWEEGAGLIQWKKLLCKFPLWTHVLLYLSICNRVICKRLKASQCRWIKIICA